MSALAVNISDTRVGILEQFEEERQRFSFCEQYVTALLESRPVLGQIFEDRFPNSISVDGPICWFTHLLPQGAMLRWRSELLGIDQDDVFELLKYLGGDLPGAVTLTPCDSQLRPKQTDHRSPAPPKTKDATRFRFSLAGAQWKLSARAAGRGLTTRATFDGTALIAKFHSPEYPGLPRCEFATMTWAQASGLLTPAFALRKVSDFDEIPEEMNTGDGNVFVIDRFDRTSTRRIHIEDFGQILDRPPGHSQYQGTYEELGSVIRWIAPESAHEFLRSVVFHVVAGNGDAHLKNFSVIYPDGRNAALSPAYDVVSTVLYFPPSKNKLALQLDGQGEFKSVTLGSFSRLIDCLGIEPSIGRAIVCDFVDAAFAAWNDVNVQNNFDSAQVERLQAHIDSLPLSKLRGS
ncbi:Serine/threonine-protein kinase HipA [Rosistilla oblonga]|uniref:type II toxin-antitoxin system HipA family toxin n=1 Tax=Rosistilla oblonga TaxID=2527990 RepID=UPI00118ADD98|nr:type II toxin-antitoxin system HipA family toxin [Rosistilla oblonga]QDV14662.1 Serine/threonine-protein kinase HipA [Rosistilla oblonga]